MNWAASRLANRKEFQRAIEKERFVFKWKFKFQCPKIVFNILTYLALPSISCGVQTVAAYGILVS